MTSMHQPRDCFSFLQMKKVLKGKCSVGVEEVKQKTAEAQKGIITNGFKNCFEQWDKHLDRYTAPKGEYFESN